jgi:hypothetical protein
MYNVAFDDNSKEASVLAFKTIQYPPFFKVERGRATRPKPTSSPAHPMQACRGSRGQGCQG